MEDQLKKRARLPFGQKKDTSKNLTSDSVDKWKQAISDQLSETTTYVNVQNVALTSMSMDPENARQFKIEIEELKKAPSPFESEYGKTVDEKFISQIRLYFSNDEQKVAEYLGLCELALSIEKPSQMINPVTSYLEGSKLAILAGHRRYMAHWIMKASEIQTKILNAKPSKFQHTLLQWFENQHREDLKLYERLINIRKLAQLWEMENVGEKISSRKLASLASISRSYAGFYLAIIAATLDNKLLENSIKTGKIESLEAAYRLSQFNLSIQKELLNKLESGEMLVNDVIKRNLKTTDELNQSNSNSSLIKSHDTGLHIRRSTNLKAIARLIEVALENEELSYLKSDFANFDFSSKKGITAAWNKLYEVLIQKIA